MKYFSLVVFSMISLITTAQKKVNDRFILTGTVLNQQDGFVYLSYADKDGKFVRDSAALKNGSFRFTGFITEPAMASFSGKLISRSSEDPNYTNIFLEHG